MQSIDRLKAPENRGLLTKLRNQTSNNGVALVNNSNIKSVVSNSNSGKIITESSETNKAKAKNIIHNVRILNDKFEPDYLRIQRGEVVQWTLGSSENN